MALTTSITNSYALTANSTDAVSANNGTDTSITYTTTGGKLSAQFNGSTSKIVTSAAGITGTTDFTIAGWVYVTNAGIDQNFTSNRKASDDNLGIYNFRIVGSNSKINFWDFDGGAFGFNTTSYSTGALTVNTWYHIAFTRVGTAGTYYINGSASGTSTASALKSYSTSSTHPISFGHEPANGNEFVGGNLVSWQFYTRALSGAEMSQLYNGGTVLQYPFATANTTNFFF